MARRAYRRDSNGRFAGGGGGTVTYGNAGGFANAGHQQKAQAARGRKVSRKSRIGSVAKRAIRSKAARNTAGLAAGAVIAGALGAGSKKAIGRKFDRESRALNAAFQQQARARKSIFTELVDAHNAANPNFRR